MSAATNSLNLNAPCEQPSCWNGTPEVYFAKAIDNSRLVKVADPTRARETRQFLLAISLLFAIVMGYAWQHFKAIEYGYKIETLKRERDTMVDQNHALRVEDSTLRSPERIDQLARAMGMQPPDATQVLHLDVSVAEGASAQVATLNPVSVISVQ